MAAEKSMMGDEGGGCASSEPFALRVMGDSMEPEFKDGCIVIVDPASAAAHGAYVIAEHQGDYIFRQLLIAENRVASKADRHDLAAGGDFKNNLHGVASGFGG